MTRTRAHRPWNVALSLPLALGALALGGLSSCDNPACVFGPSVCQNLPGGGANAVAATFPDTGELVVPNGPRVEAVFPTGFAHPESPIVLVFSESISPSTIQDAFTVQSTSGFGGGGGSASAALIGDGRVLILIPTGLVPGQEFEISYTEDASVRDLSGALALQPADGVVGSFTVDDDPSETPEVLMTWPFDGATGVSTITEVVTVFNRVMDPTTFSGLSWNVLVDGIPPAFDALPEMIEISSGGPGGAVPESRVWRWRSINPTTDARQSLGENLPITVNLSTGPQSLTTLAAPGEMEGVALPATTISATTAGFSPPSNVVIITDPTDAIGIENLNGVDPLMLEVEFTPVTEEGDVLEIFLVGSNPSEEPDAPNLISLQRELPQSAGTATTMVNADDLGLTSSMAPLITLFADGDVSLAFAVRRGDARSALRVLDVDTTTDGIQDALLDTVPPTFLNVLGLEEGETVYLSDLRELSLAGFASEEPRSVELVAMLSGGAVDNRVGGQLPPLPAFNLGGAFVSAPIDLGIVPQSEFPLDVAVIVYDRAFNPSVPFTLQYTQRAGSGEGTSLSPPNGLDIQVTVFDQATLEPIVMADVYAHEYVAGVVTPGFAPQAMTDANGFATIASGSTGITVVTVEAAGYDLFSFQAVPTTRLDVPMTQVVPPLGAATILSASQGEELASPFLENRVADSRLPMPGETTALSDACNYNVLTNQTTCSFLPQLGIRAEETGMITFLSTKAPNDLNDPDAFSAGTFLQAFELNYPRLPVGATGVDSVLLQVGDLLSGASVPPGDVPLGTAPQVFSKPPNYDIDFSSPMGGPRVSVEAFTNGIRGVMTVGLGVPYFDSFADSWDIRAAYSARARAGGELASQLAIEDDRLLRVEVVDASGNRSGVRQPLSTATGTLSPPSVSELSAPSGMTMGAAYDLVYENVLDGTQDEEGLYHVLLVDSAGRRWHLWTLDPPTSDGLTVTTHVPPITIQGGTPLASGAITCFVDAWSWEGFAPQSFLFSDILRRHDRFTSAAPKVFSQP